MNDTISQNQKYGDERRLWKSEFVGYMLKIVNHPNYKGIPDGIDGNGQIRWNAPSNRPPGRWQDLRDRRLAWWKIKAKEQNIEVDGKWISQVAKAIHPFKEKPCQTCGRVMSLDYVYPTKNTFQKINLKLPEKDKLKYEDFLTIYEIVSYLSKKLGVEGYNVLITIFPDLNRAIRTDKGFIEFLSKEIVSQSPRGKLSPGAMSNAPDRLDGFHTYNLCCRHKQDTGRSVENLRTYTDDRRAFEFWCEGDWAAANLLMTSGTVGICSACGKTELMTADHIGPISLGFAHSPWFKPLCSSCNSSKGNRLSLKDVKTLIKEEKSNVLVASFQIKVLWDKCKNKITSDEDAGKLSKLLRINQHYYLLLLKEIYDLGHPELLLVFLHPELAEEKIEFVGLNGSDFSFEKIIRTHRADTYSQSKAARMIRIAYDSLDDYASKEKRNIHEVAEEIESTSRKETIKVALNVSKIESKEDQRLGSSMFKALRNKLGPEERAALLEKLFNGNYKPKTDITQFTNAVKNYTNLIGTFLANEKF